MLNLNCFSGGTVIYNLESTDKFAAIQELIDKAPIFKKIKDIKTYEKSVINREKKQSTGVGHGVAFAHGKTRDVDSIYIALGVSHKGIDFNSFDGKPVYFLFIIANPPEKQLDYLLTLSILTKMIRDKNLRNNLLEYKNKEQIESKLCEVFNKINSGKCSCR